jgi:flagellar hook-associated protein 2
MVTQITLGNFYTTSEGKNVLGGAGGSGLDTKTLIESLTEAKKFPAVQDQNQITSNGKISDALTEFNNLLSNFQLASDALRNPPGVGNAASNAFLFTTSSVSSNTSVAGSNYLTINTTPGATVQNYTINEITSIATAATQSSTTFTVADVDTDSVVTAGGGAQLFKAGTITIRGQGITLDTGDTLGEIAAKFNAVSSTTGISATVIKISGTNYQLSFAATETGTANDFDLTNTTVTTVTDPDGVLAGVGFNAAGGATNAEFQINGVAVVRSSNNISDVISGVTFNLVQQTPPATTLNVSIKSDNTTVQNTIINFVKSYNALKTFEAKQTQLKNDGTYADTAILANNSTFRNIISDITSSVSAKVAGLSGTTSLADLGFSFVNQPASGDTPAVNNIINVDDGKLTQALATDFSGVRKVFGFTFSSNNPNLGIFKYTNALSVTSFTLNIDPDNVDPTLRFRATYNLGAGPVTVQLTATPINGSTGYSLKGVDGTALQGLQMIYASEDDATISVTATQGVASRIYNAAETAIAPNTGTLAVEVKSIQDRNTKLQDSIDRVNLQVAQYREQLIAKFSALEQAIARVNTILQSLDAQQQAANNNG